MQWLIITSNQPSRPQLRKGLVLLAYEHSLQSAELIEANELLKKL
jgi:hypothetical protein